MLELEYRYPVSLLCKIAGISRSSFYKYKNTPPKNDDEIDNLIKEIYNKSGKRFGYRRVRDVLVNQHKMQINRKRVQRIMQENGLKSIIRPKKQFKSEERTVLPNSLNRDFMASKPNQKFATDITYITTRTKTMYLSVVLDLYDNYPVAWVLSECQDKKLSILTIMQLSEKTDLTGSIIHSDQGVHYTNKSYIKLLKKLNVNQSMSRKGNCWDNACAESFFSQYKSECIYLYKNRIKAPEDVMTLTQEYFDFYINYRPQSRLGGLTPAQSRLSI